MTKWLVTITQIGDKFDFPIGYFPRKFAYKVDALKCKEEVERKGGEATQRLPV